MWLPWLITGIVVFDLVFTFLLIWVILRNAWKPLMLKYPRQELGEEVVTRNFQSFKFGLISLGCCIHVAVDEHFLHLTPASFFRRMGTDTISIPWNSIQDFKHKQGSRWAEIRLDRTRVIGPAWCLELASPPDDEPDEEEAVY